jgi:hypothetical protein
MKYAAEMASGRMIYVPSFMTIGSGTHVIRIKFVASTTSEAAVSVLLMGGIYEVRP